MTLLRRIIVAPIIFLLGIALVKYSFTISAASPFAFLLWAIGLMLSGFSVLVLLYPKEKENCSYGN